MSEWWTYQPSDFLMFSPRIYWRLFESINQAYWPAQVGLLVAAWAWLARQARPARPADQVWARAAACALALIWALVAWAFLLQRFAPIQWVAGDAALVFFAQALALIGLAVLGGIHRSTGRLRRRAALALGVWALVGYPLLGTAFGRPWQQAEVFGLAPDPTALATLAFLLLVRATTPASRWLMRLLWIVPVAWCLVSAATLWTMGSAQGWLVLAALALAFGDLGLRSTRAS
ncbi:MAG: DUF6064 family protein [Rubrivivax sp.]